MATGLYTHPEFLRHEMGPHHPECPDRLRAIEDQLIASRIEDLLVPCEAPPATEAQLCRVHRPEYVRELVANVPIAGYTPIDPDTSMNPHTYMAAVLAAGAAVDATDKVIAGELENAFCSVRPPGHHAEPGRAMGFCFFNNVAVAARHALDHHGLQRVAIIDFDVHHGNGTEAAFRDEPRVLMCSIFQHPFYPYSGTEAVAPNMVNIPLPAYTNGLTVREVVGRSGCRVSKRSGRRCCSSPPALTRIVKMISASWGWSKPITPGSRNSSCTSRVRTPTAASSAAWRAVTT